jgi:hypothetical protein
VSCNRRTPEWDPSGSIRFSHESFGNTVGIALSLAALITFTVITSVWFNREAR